MATVAILGLGAMGTRMAQNLLQSEHTVVVYNRSQEKVLPLVQQGAIAAENPREAALQSDIVISMVRDNDASRDMWLMPEMGAVWGLDKNKIAIESSTLTLAWTKELAHQLALTGAAFLDAPVVGSRPQAEAKQLISLVGGEATDLAKAAAVLQAAGAKVIYHVGDMGQGMLMKLVVNSLFGMQVVAMAEAIVLLRHSGMTPENALECLGKIPVVSPAAKGAASLMVAEKHEPLFPIHLVAKDFAYMTETAQALSRELLAAQAIGKIYQQAIEQGYGDSNITGIIKLFEAA